MTFGEHLEELRVALMKSAIALAIGLGIGLFFANRVVQFVQVPLQGAINRFMADKTLYKMGIDPGSKDAKVLEFKEILVEKALVSETVYVRDNDASAIQRDDPFASTTVDEDKDSASSDRGESKPIETNSDPKPEESGESTKPEVPKEETDPAKDNTNESTSDDALLIAESIPSLQDLRAVEIWRPVEAGLNSFQMEEPFMIWLKAGLVIGAIISSPFIFYYIWQFVAAGLYTHERKYVYVYAPFSVGLFWSGVLLAFFLVLKYVLDFLLTFNASMNVDLVPRLSNYVSFVLLLPLGFGVAFQLPLVMLFLQRIGLFETQAYIGSWRIAVLVIAILSMILTPADIYSMIALMVPLIFLYFLGIAMCKYMPKGRGIGSEGYDPA